MKNYQGIISTAIMAIVLLVAIYIAKMELDSWLKHQAVTSCLKTATYTFQGGNDSGRSTSTEPMTNWYKTCMKSKGY
ncbi:MAG TPA: hypothetical protein VK338_04015 [Candidatus Nitrosocosmicus sp.]|nr:hypothetical protein [Candidatus Nitrosocosmicus sp.]